MILSPQSPLMRSGGDPRGTEESELLKGPEDTIKGDCGRTGGLHGCPISPPSPTPSDADVVLSGDSRAQICALALRLAMGERYALFLNANCARHFWATRPKLTVKASSVPMP
jgi:hypothetical protein